MKIFVISKYYFTIKGKSYNFVNYCLNIYSFSIFFANFTFLYVKYVLIYNDN